MNGLPLVNQQAQFQVQPKKNILYLLAVPASGYIDVTNVDVVILKPTVNSTINGFQGGIPGQVIKFIGICGAGITITLKEDIGLNPLYNFPPVDVQIPVSTTQVLTYTNVTTPTETDVWYLDSTSFSTGGVITNTLIDSYTNEVGADHIHFKIKAMEALNPGDVIRATGWNAGNNAAEVYKVNDPTNQIAIGICHDTLAIGDFGLAVHDGFYEGLNTSGFALGDILYPNSSGGLTNVKPSGSYQAVAYVLRVQTNNGAVLCSFGDLITPGTVTWDTQLAQVVWATPGAEVSNSIEVSASSKDITGATLLTDQIGVTVIVSDGAADTEPSATATISAASTPVGTLLAGGGTATAVFKTDSSGNFKIKVTETAAASRYIWVRAGGHFQRYVKARDGVLQLTFT